MAEYADSDSSKGCLARALFAEPELSPIAESPSLSSSVDRPLRRRRARRADTESPLPELIVEPERKRRHDHSEHFYDKLEVKMKKFYRKIFSGGDEVMGDSMSESLTNDSGSFTEENRSEGTIIILDDLSPIENADQSEAELESLNSTVLLSEETYELTEVRERPRRQRNASINDLESTVTDDTTGSENNYIFVKKAIVHATQDRYNEEPETMRKQRSSSEVELLLSGGDNTPKHSSLDLNIAQLTMEQMSASTPSINSPTMEVRSIMQEEPPMRSNSPILGQKRPSNDQNRGSTKKRRVTDEINSISNTNKISYKDISNVHDTFKINNRDVQVQGHHHINSTEIQIGSVTHRDVGTRTDEYEEYIMCRHASTQTEQNDRTEQSTQTGGQFIENCQIYIINNINITRE